MESRIIIYYPRNSLAAKPQSIQSVKKRLKQDGMGIADPNQKHIIPIIPKVYATKNCRWCPADFDSFQIVCGYCNNCQYCGMVSNSRRKCDNCGNHIDDDLANQKRIDTQHIKFF